MLGRRRREDDDPFAALRHQSPGETTRVGTVRPARDAFGEQPPPDPRDAAAAAPHASRRPRDRRGSDRLLVLLTIVLAVGGAGALVWQSERDADERGSGSGDAVGGERGEPAASGGGQGERANLVRPDAFERALAAVEQELRPGERITILHVAPDRINVSTRLRDGGQRFVTVADDLSLDALDAGSAGGLRPIPLARVDPRAPWRAVRAAARKGRFPASKLDYLVLTGPLIPGRAAEWSLFFTDVAPRDRLWNAALGGSPVQRPGERTVSSTTTTRSSVTVRRNGRTIELTGGAAERIMRCVRRAGTDAAKIQRCLP